MNIPLSVPYIGNQELKAMQRVLRSGWLTDGPKNAEFEEKFSTYIGCPYALTLNSCTSALQLALEALAITGEVIVPSFTFVASANAVVKAGAIPVFADIEVDSCNIDPAELERKITSKTQAVMVVHFAGQSCRMDEIMSIARRHHLHVIEDSAETLGGMYKNQKTGSFSTGCFSFFPTKNITTGEGGMLTTRDQGLAQKVRVLAGHGILKSAYQRTNTREPWHREACMAGYNYRMSSLLAAMGIEQLKKLDRMNSKRRQHAFYLNRYLDCPQISVPREQEHCYHVYQMYTIQLRGVKRRAFILGLRQRGIMASVHFWPPVHLQKYYVQTYGYCQGDLPVTEQVSDRIVTLPMYPQLTKRQLDYMIDSVRIVLKKTKI